MLVEFKEYRFQTCLMKVPDNNMDALRELSLLFADNKLEVIEC